MNVIYQFDESIETQRAQRKCSFHALKHVADNAIMCRSFATCTTVEEISSILLGNETVYLAAMCSLRWASSVAVKVTVTWQQQWQNLLPHLIVEGGNAAGSLYRSPAHWLIRLIALIESHPSPTVWPWDEGKSERLWPPGSGMGCHWTATFYYIKRTTTLS